MAPSSTPAGRVEQAHGRGRGRKTARFRKSSRLLRHADFQRVYKQGRRQFAAHMTVFYLPRQNVARPPAAAEVPEVPLVASMREDINAARIGLTVGRVLGGAVDRNRIKRRLREAVRANLAALPGAVDVVINPKKSALTAEFSVLRDEVARAFQLIAGNKVL